MPNSKYYRDQARVLMNWASVAHDRGTTERLAARAQQMLLLAEITDDNPDQQTKALDIFNAAQMGGAARHPRLK